MSERTFSIIKPDAVAAGNAGNIIQMITNAGLTYKAMKLLHMSQAQAEGFYAVHKERPFYGELVEFMTSGPVVVGVLEGDNAIARYRDLMGPTNSTEAPKGTIRGEYGSDIQNNAVHGSDAPETAKQEVNYFFTKEEFID
ncbi:MAG: nucleoside-diphosphate kinase [Proteobacteria bacterium]|nr:nucleoside-diphosphate kinase [Pseudomonadota bacterium]